MCYYGNFEKMVKVTKKKKEWNERTNTKSEEENKKEKILVKGF